MARTLLLPLLAASACAAVFKNNFNATPVPPSNTTSNATVPSNSTSAASSNSILIDTFNSTAINALGFFYGTSGDTAYGEFQESDGGTYLKVSTGNIDASFVTSVAEGCTDWTKYKDHYIHITYGGSPKFSVSLQQHNKDCDDAKVPFPETWDSVQAPRYSTKPNAAFANESDIYIPVSHFDIDLKRTAAVAVESWYTNDTTWLYSIELVPANDLPRVFPKPAKLPSGQLRVSCTQPNLIAFGIDDGSPKLLQRTLGIIKEEQIPVTFFVQGKSLNLPAHDGNFTNAYLEMIQAGHQIGLHSQTHPHVESVQTQAQINDEIIQNVDIVKQKLNVTTKYFRPPYGTIGARTRQALGQFLGQDSQIMLWSVDIRDWVFGVDEQTGDPDRQQYKAYVEGVEKGGDIVVMHNLYNSTVDQFRDMIRYAKKKGKKFVRMDQCVGDKDAPESWGWKRNGNGSERSLIGGGDGTPYYWV